MRRFLAVLLALCLLPVLGLAEESASETPVVRISVEGYGDIYAELYPETAPITVENFLNLVDSGFYDGLTFHRIISGFMIQGGDPLGNGTGGSGKNIKGEFSANGVENPLKHERGVLSMARSQQNDSASSQFFIMHADASHLDGSYAAFGKVLAGMEVVDRVCGLTPVEDNNGSVLRENQPVIKSIVRAQHADADAAAEEAARNGLEGVWRDPSSTVSIQLPEGWKLTEQASYGATFTDGGEASFMVAVQSLWARNAGIRSSVLQSGGAREMVGTALFNRESLGAMLTDDLEQLRDETHGGVLYYAAEAQTESGPITNWLGVSKGMLILVTADQCEELIPGILDSLTVD